MSIRHPVSLAASLTFCPSLPMANESCLSGTTTVDVPSASFSSTFTTWAGLSALAIKVAGVDSHSTTSILSPFSSFTIFCILMPRNPTQQPTASIPCWCVVTAILPREPASRAIAFSSTVPLEISGTSSSRSRRSKSGWERDTTTLGPLLV